MNGTRTSGPWRLLNVVVLLSLALALLPGTALARPAEQAQESTAADASAFPATVLTPQGVTTTDPTTAPVTCPDSTRPATAQRISVARDEEIGVSFKGSNSDMHWYYQNYTGGSAFTYSGSTAYDVNNSWQRSVAADLNGDGYDEILTAYKGGDGMLGLQDVIWHPGIVNWRDIWFPNTGRLTGGDTAYIDLAAGDIFRQNNGRQQVVVATSNRDHDLEMVILAGNSDGSIWPDSGYVPSSGQFHNTDDGRGTVHHVAVATGDLDGNGYDDEMVTAFKDGDNHLQVLVTRRESTGWNIIADYRFSDAATAHWADNICKSGDSSESPERGLDVTTGDVDGDMKDEAVLAFVDSGNQFQILAMGLTPGNTLEEKGYYRAEEDTSDPDFVSVAAPDLNADGKPEILAAFTPRNSNAPVQVWRLAPSTTSGTGLDRQYVWKDSTRHDAGDYEVPRYVSIQKANPNRDAQQGAYLAFNAGRDGNDWIATRLLKEVQVTLPVNSVTGLQVVAYANIDGGAATNYDVTALAGDIDNNSSHLTYTGVCKEYGESAVSTVVNQPPQWAGVNAGPNGVGAAYGQTRSGGQTTGKTTTFNYGASYTIDGSVSFLDIFEMGPQMTMEFEGSHAVNKEDSVEASTTKESSSTFGSDSAYGFVVDDSVTFHAYKYTESLSGKEVWVRLPFGKSNRADVIEKWNSMRNYKGWLPIGLGPRVNLALGKTATQSSTFGGTALASRAVDGNTDGMWNNNSLSSTNADANAWWQVDLGSSQPIDTIDVYNRLDCCVDRLKNYVVMVSDTNSWTAPKWTSGTQTAAAGQPTVLPIGISGRYVRVQLLGTNYLSLAEVQVWKNTRVNLARDKTATQSSTYGGTALASRAVDGNTDGNFANNSVSSTNSEANAWWQVDLGSSQLIGGIEIWNRTDCCADRLKDYVVKVSETGTDWDSPKWTSPTFQDVAGRPGWVTVGQAGRYVRIQLIGTNYLNLAEVQVYPTRQASDFPKSLLQNSDQYFTIYDQSGNPQKVVGNLKWDWCSGYRDDTVLASLVKSQQPLFLYAGGADQSWNMSTATGGSSGWEDTYGFSTSWGMEAKVMGAGAEWSVNVGMDFGKSSTVSWNNETYFEGTAGHLPQGTASSKNYKYCPYYYATKSTSADGVDQVYMVLDYYVPCTGTSCGAMQAADQAGAAVPSVTAPAVKPQTPVISSATHPDPNAWSQESTATFNWEQPAGDPETNPVYRWLLDQQPSTVPDAPGQGSDKTYTYYDLPDGAWYLHVRAMGSDGQWSDTAHRQIRIDRNAPDVALALDPALPNGNQGWYRDPLAVTATFTDTGSGPANLEVSTNGTNWQPYTDPLHFTSNTPGTTVWARGSDQAGNVSVPVSTTFKIDMTAPDSHVAADCGIWGVCEAGIVTDAMGNEHLVLSGQIAESASGRAGMEIQADGGSWTSASALGEWHPFPAKPAVTTNWYYTGTLDLAHGYHIFQGRAADGAGNLEAPYKIAEMIWYPAASPDLSGSTITVEPAVVRPGASVTVTLAVRNGGRQEAHVAISATLPAGLAPAPGALASIDASTTYVTGTGVITWPSVLLWPGDSRHISFRAIVANGLAAGNLTAKLGARGSWPNVDLLPVPAWQKQFRDKEASVTTGATLKVDPLLTASKDVLAPHVQLSILDGEVAAKSKVNLRLQADPDATWMLLREWTLDPASGTWVVAGDSGWLGYKSSLSWTLSDGAGVKYIGAWVTDAAGNVSRLDEASLAFTNRLVDDSLLAGQRRQYRFNLDDGIAVYNLLAYTGQADLYGWMPGLGQHPTYMGEGTGNVKTLGFVVGDGGLYLVEAAAQQDGTYALLAATASAAENAHGPSQATVLPDHPLTLSTPLTGGWGSNPDLLLNDVFIPMIVR